MQGTISTPGMTGLRPGVDRISSGFITTASLSPISASANTFVAVNAQGASVAGVSLDGTWTGTLAFEGTVDGHQWFGIYGTPPLSGSSTTQATTNGYWSLSCAGLAQVRTHALTLTAGTAVVNWEISIGENPNLIIANPANLPIPVSGTIASIIGNWPATIGVSGSQLTGSTFSGFPFVMGGAYGLGTLGAPQTNFGVRAVNVDISGSVFVKELKDFGRTPIMFVTSSVTGVLGEALISLQAVRGYQTSGSITGQTSWLAASSGKTFRLQAMTLSWNNVTAVSGSVLVRLRVHPSASVTAKSLSIASIGIGSFASTGPGGIGFVPTSTSVNFPDGIEFSGANQIGVTQQAGLVAGAFDIALIGYEYSN
jgi:hypothetical protein